MRHRGMWVAALLLAAATMTSCEEGIEMKPMLKAQLGQLKNWLLPLPKELKFEGTIPDSGGVRVCTDEDAELIQCAAGELKEALGGKLSKRGFRICIGTRSSAMFGKLKGIPDLDSAKNADQAYAIVPIPGMKENRVAGLALIGRTPTGAYYATKTLMQLIEGALEVCRGELPIVSVRDWPDMEERGQWGGSANKDVEWFAGMKLNLVEAHCRFGYDDKGKVYAEVDQELVERCRKHAVKFVAIITHLDCLGRTNLFKKYPETKGVKGEKKLRSTLGVVCWSKPNAPKALSEWMCEIAKQGGVRHINVWLAEHPGTKCACKDCKDLAQYEAETKAAVKAFRAAKKINPDLTLRILLTQGSYAENDKVLAATPKDVGISYYDGGRTYNSNQEPMIYPLLEKFAADGGWLGCYPQVTASWRIVCPWSGPQFMKYRMTEFVNKGLRNVCTYATPSNRFYDFNVTASAEWLWNSTGRSERDCALAWATRRQFYDPERAADWAMTLGQVGWNVYGAHVPYPWFFGRIPSRVKGGFPDFTKEPFLYMKSEKGIDDNLAACVKAMVLARTVGAAELIHETQVITGYVQMLKGFYQLSKVAAKKKTLNADEKKKAAEIMKLVNAGTDNVVEGLRQWQKTVAPDVQTQRVSDTVRVTEETTGDVAAGLAKLGVEDPNRAYRTQRIGGWETADFAKGAKIHKKWDVTLRLDGPGTYRVQFIHTRGWCGLSVQRVALALANPKAPDKPAELACDKHVGSIGYHPKNDVYTLELKAHDPKGKYFLIADVRGSNPTTPEDKRGCNGMVIMRKLKK